MQSKNYLLIFIVLLALIGLCKRLFLNSCKDARLKKKTFAGLFIFNALVIVGFVWSMVDFKLYWVVIVVFFLPIVAVTLLNILTTEFCESCGMTIHKYKFWQPFEGCPVCKQLITKQNLEDKI